MTAAPLILTLGLDAEAQARFDRLRTAHFPPDRNHISAHVTLFHALPGAELPAITRAVASRCDSTPAFVVQATGVRSIGRGVVYALDAPPLQRLRADLAALWQGWLTPQDRQGFRPHVTIQNKAEPEAVRALLEAMQAGFAPFAVRAEGLALWRYLGGPWEPVSAHAFARDGGMAGPGRTG